MGKREINNLKIIYGIDLIAFGIVLACHLFVNNFNFNDYWSLFVVVPSLVDVILNKSNIFNLSLFIISSSIFGYFIFNNGWASLIILAILIGMVLVFGKFIAKGEKTQEKEKTQGPF